MDGGIIVAYLVTFLLGGARRFADPTLDRILQRLCDPVVAQLRGDPSLDELKNNPRDEYSQRQVRAVIDRIARGDPQFAGALDAMQRDLDRRGGRQAVRVRPRIRHCRGHQPRRHRAQRERLRGQSPRS